jgi:light-regulated signal transduction histidine kinase (bacteriophytochrome)
MKSIQPMMQEIISDAENLLASENFSREAHDDTQLILDAAQRLRGLVARMPVGDLLEHAPHERFVHRLLIVVNTILGFSRVMLKGMDGTLTSAQEGHVERIHSHANAIRDYIYDLFNIEIINKQGVVNQAFSVERLLNRISATQQPRNHALFITLPASALPLVSADRAYVYDALTHLLYAVIESSDLDSEINLKAYGQNEQVQISFVYDGPELPIAHEDVQHAAAVLRLMRVPLQLQRGIITLTLPMQTG